MNRWEFLRPAMVVAVLSLTLAPVRFGVGRRQGANIGYLHFTRKFSPVRI